MTAQSDLPLATYSQLVRDLTGLGVEPGQTIMLHASVRAIGWIVGAAQSYLFDATALHAFAVRWMEQTFGPS